MKKNYLAGLFLVIVIHKNYASTCEAFRSQKMWRGIETMEINSGEDALNSFRIVADRGNTNLQLREESDSTLVLDESKPQKFRVRVEEKENGLTRELGLFYFYDPAKDSRTTVDYKSVVEEFDFSGFKSNWVSLNKNFIDRARGNEERAIRDGIKIGDDFVSFDFKKLPERFSELKFAQDFSNFTTRITFDSNTRRTKIEMSFTTAYSKEKNKEVLVLLRKEHLLLLMQIEQGVEKAKNEYQQNMRGMLFTAPQILSAVFEGN